jgi:hypothetical protein
MLFCLILLIVNFEFRVALYDIDILTPPLFIISIQMYLQALLRKWLMTAGNYAFVLLVIALTQSNLPQMLIPLV